MTAKLEDIEDLKHTFNVKPTKGNKLPNPKDVADGASFYLKSGNVFEKHKMVSGGWFQEIVVNGKVILQRID